MDTSKGKVLVVTGNIGTADFLSDALDFAGLPAVRVADAGPALDHLSGGEFSLLIVDFDLPTIRGDDLMKRAIDMDCDLAVLLVTSPGHVPLAVRCLREGAADYLLQPFDLQEVAIRACRALEVRKLKIADRDHKRELERQVADQRERLLDVTKRSLHALAIALEAKDPFTKDHSERVAALALRIAEHLYPSDLRFQESVQLAAQLHDLGMIGVSEAAIGHPGPISDEVFQEIKRHPGLGESILRPLIRDDEVLGAIRHHHEQFDGRGYPDGLRGPNIPIGARIIAVADAYDAMVSARPFRAAKQASDALAALREGAGEQWDPQIVDAIVMIEGYSATSTR